MNFLNCISHTRRNKNRVSLVIGLLLQAQDGPTDFCSASETMVVHVVRCSLWQSDSRHCRFSFSRYPAKIIFLFRNSKYFCNYLIPSVAPAHPLYRYKVCPSMDTEGGTTGDLGPSFGIVGSTYLIPKFILV